MRVTREEVREATEFQEVDDLTELSLANKYVHEVGFVAKMRSLRDLNLAFNELEAIDDLCRNTELRTLNVAHNKLRSLAGTESMTQLHSLRASNNRLRGVQPLAACRSLEECWLQQNKLADLAAVVETLRRLPNLRNLVLMGNPCCERAEYRSWVISQLPSLQLLDGQDVKDERSRLGDGPAPQLGRLCSTDIDVVDHSGSSDGDSDADEHDGDGGRGLRRGEWTVTDARGQKVHMGRKSKHTNQAKNARAAPRRSEFRDYDYGLQPAGEAVSSSPRDELRQALAGMRKWTQAALPVVERFAAAIAATVAASSGEPHGASARGRSRSRHTPRERARGGTGLASDRKAANAATETCRRLQRAASHAASEAAPSLRLAEELLKQLERNSNTAREEDTGSADTAEKANSRGSGVTSRRSPGSPRGSPGQRRRKRSGRSAASVHSRMNDASLSARSVSSSRGKSADNGSRGSGRPSSTPRSPQLTGRRAKSTGRPGSNSRGSRGSNGSATSSGHLSRTSRSKRSMSTSRHERQPPPQRSPHSKAQPRPQQPQQDRRVSDVAPAEAKNVALDQSISDSDSGSDSDLETIGLAAAARVSNRSKARNGAARTRAAHLDASLRQDHLHLQLNSVPRAKSAVPRPTGSESASSQYVPATVELLAAEASQGASNAGAYSWHAAAAEFGAAESSLGLPSLAEAAGSAQGVRAVASDPPYADSPLNNANLVRGSIAIVQRGLCTFLEKARRVQEAGGIGVIFVNTAETLFVPHGTEDDPGGDIRIPACCLRKKDGDMLLAIASLGHEGTAQIAMTF